MARRPSQATLLLALVLGGALLVLMAFLRATAPGGVAGDGSVGSVERGRPGPSGSGADDTEGLVRVGEAGAAAGEIAVTSSLETGTGPSAGERAEGSAPGTYLARFIATERRVSFQGADATTLPTAVRGATVARVQRGGRDIQASWRATAAEADGAFELVVALGDTGDDAPALDLVVEAPGHVPLRCTVDLQPAAEAIDAIPLALLREARLLVRCDGYPVGATGQLYLWNDSDGRRSDADRAVDWPGTAEFTVDALEPGPLSVALSVPGFPVVTRQALFVAGGETLVVDIVARDGETARGIVVDLETGASVADVRVVARPEVSGLRPEIERDPYAPVTTGLDGRFEITGLPRGQVDIQLITSDGATHDRDILVIEGNATREHRLSVRGTASLAGRVLPGEGASLVGLSVVATTRDSARRVRRGETGLRVPEGGVAAVLGPDGGFSLDRVPSGRRLALVATSDDALVTMLEISALGRGEEREGVVLDLTARERLRFRLTTGDAAPPSEVSAQLNGDRPSGGRGWSSRARLTADEDGGYTLAAEVGSPTRIRLRAEGFLETVADWPSDLAPGSPPPTFELRPSRRLTVEVAGAHGGALRGARVRVFTPPPDASPTASAGGSGGRGRTAGTSERTDAYGRATLDLDPDGDWLVRVDARGYQARTDLTVPAGSNARMRVVLDELPRVEPARVEGRIVRAGSGAALNELRFDGLRGGTALVEGVRFELVGLAPGPNVSVVVHSRGFESFRLPISDLEEGARVDVGELVMRGATRVDITVFAEEGSALRDASVRLDRLPKAKGGRDEVPPFVRFPGRAEGAGLYRRESVPRATWQLVVRRRGYRTHSQELEVQGGRVQKRVVLQRP